MSATSIVAKISLPVPFLAVFASRIEQIDAMLRSYTLLVGAVGGSFAAAYWGWKWCNRRKD